MSELSQDCNTDDSTLAYIAGFFDGEGSICITSSKKERYVLNVCLVQTNREILEWIKLVLDCKGIIYSRSRAGSLGKKVCYVLQWPNASAGAVLRKMLPYLRVKKGKAQIAIEFQETMTRKHCGRGTPENVIALRESLREQIKEA
jgi:LAGLIDADG DNA endonuclease family protein